jgi:hypothetical protein
MSISYAHVNNIAREEASTATVGGVFFVLLIAVVASGCANTPLPRSANEFHALSRWEYRPNLALRHDPIAYEAASLKHPLPCRCPNKAGRPLTRPRQRGRLNRAVRKTARNLNSRRRLRKVRHPKAGTN